MNLDSQVEKLPKQKKKQVLIYRIKTGIPIGNNTILTPVFPLMQKTVVRYLKTQIFVIWYTVQL